MVGDSVTTDHISPAGDIAERQPGRARGSSRAASRSSDFNSVRLAPRQRSGHGARHVREHPAQEPARAGLRGQRHASICPTARRSSVFDAAERYRKDGVPLVVLAGKEYGSGSSRDWAAKGTLLLGVRAVLAESYERIHRSNLVRHGRAAAAVRERADRREPRPHRARSRSTIAGPRRRARAAAAA